MNIVNNSVFQKMKDLNDKLEAEQKMIQKRETGYWVEVGKVGCFFPYEDKDAYSKAIIWRDEQIKHIDPEQSKQKVAFALSSLEGLLYQVRDEFPLAGRKEDFFYYIDEKEQTIVLRLGALNVYVNDQGLFGADLIVNWLTKEPVRLCSNLPLSVMAEFLKGTQGSRTYSDFEPTGLYLNETNTDFISQIVKLSK